MESILQQKMEQFRLDPDPADWQAIEERLHPKKRRRFFWWIFPLAGAILIGGMYYLTTQQRSSSTTQQLSNSTTQQPSNPTTQQLSNLTEQQKSSKKLVSSETTVSAVHRKSIDKTNRFAKTTTQEIKQSVPVVQMPDEDQVSARHLATVDMDRWRPALDIPSSIAYTSALQNTSSKSVVMDSALAPKKIPNKSTHNDKGWYLGAYVGLGRNHPFEPIGGTKAMDLNSSAGNGGFSTFTQGTANWRPGHHANLGLIVQKKNKKTELSFGLGLQSNGWSQTYTIYKDSILQNGTLFSRSTVANPTVKYQQLALELPLLIGFKLGGKQNNSWWIHTGLNNALVMNLRGNSNANTQVSTPIPGASASVADSLLQSNKRSYLAQWQLGITYNHSGAKQHWQLRPYLQYGLQSVSKSGEPDVNLFQWGLQWRYYFKKLK
ncbi:MAG: hypothetical protein WBP58_11105 [Chitinophagaceae bacterium]